MSWWRYAPVSRQQAAAGAAVVAAGSAAGNTGQAAQRPDQGAQPPSSAVAPSQAAGTLRARLVLIGGTSAGVFVYDPSIGAGNLIASVTDAAADPFGDTTVKGIASYVAGNTALNAQLTAGELQFNNTGLTGVPAISGGGSFSNAQLNLDSGTTASFTVAPIVQLVPDATSGFIRLGGVVRLADLAVPSPVAGSGAGPAVFGSTASGCMRFVSDTLNGDGVTYDTGRNVAFNASAVPIPASGFTAVASQAVIAGTYYFEGIFRLKQGAIGSIPGNIGFTSPSVSFSTWYAFWSLQAATTTFNSTATLGLGTQLNVLQSQTVAGDEVVAWFRGIVTFSASGTFTAGCQADGTHAFTAQPGCIFTVRPVG